MNKDYVDKTRGIKYQCTHQDTGLCKTCFEYEQEISRLKVEARLGNISYKEAMKLKEDKIKREAFISHLKEENEKWREQYEGDGKCHKCDLPLMPPSCAKCDFKVVDEISSLKAQLDRVMREDKESEKAHCKRYDYLEGVLDRVDVKVVRGLLKTWTIPIVTCHTLSVERFKRFRENLAIVIVKAIKGDI